MPESLAAMFGYPSAAAFLILAGAAVIGGVIRGFTGFGFAMVFVPIATLALGPAKAVALIWIIDIPFAVPLAVSSFRRVDWREVLPLLAGASVAAPLGVWVLVNSDPGVARWIVALSILAATVALATGWRYHGAPGIPLSLGVGGLSGTASGLAQLGGMPVAIFWLAAQKNDARQTKDNLNGYFVLLPVVTGLLYWWSGILTAQMVWMALPLMLPYGIAMAVGSRMFHLAPEKTFRRVAYGVIGMAAVIALPLMDPLLGR
jgi:uncharacterized protein